MGSSLLVPRWMFVRPAPPERRRAGFLEAQPWSDRAGRKLLDTKPGEWWLKGHDLENWKGEHPDAAQAWFSESDDEKR